MGNACAGGGSGDKSQKQAKKGGSSESHNAPLDTQDYFFTDVNKVQAEEHLGQCEGRGTFLVRKSQTVSGEYSISVRNDEMVKHYRIQQQPTPPHKFYLSQQAYFESVPELVRFYQENTGTGGLRLTTAAPHQIDNRPNTYV